MTRNALATAAFTLARDAFGQLVLTSANGERHAGVVPVRAFPISAPQQGFALVSGDGAELAWVDSLQELPAATRALLEEELASREFMPLIRRIVAVSTYATPSQWDVDTDRGPTRFTLKGEEDIRRISRTDLLISDSHGIQYLLRDLDKLDRASRKLLDRFL